MFTFLPLMNETLAIGLRKRVSAVHFFLFYFLLMSNLVTSTKNRYTVAFYGVECF